MSRAERSRRLARAIEAILVSKDEVVDYFLESELAEQSVTEQLETLLLTVEGYVLPDLEQNN